MGNGPQVSTPASTPPDSQASQEREAHAPTRNTRALSPTALVPSGPASAAARARASSAVSSTARVHSLSSPERCVAPWASAPRPKYARPIRSHSCASVESRAARPRSVASEAVSGGGGACSSVASASALQMDVAMLLRGIPIALGGQGCERVDQPGPGVARIDDVVHVAARRREIRMGEFLAVLPLSRLGRVVLVKDFHGALRPHDGDLRGGPCDVVVATDVLRVHHVVGAAVGFAGDDRKLGDGRLAVGEQQLGAVLDDPAVLLRHAGKESGHVLERDERDVEGIAEPDEPGALERGVDIEHARQRRGLIRDDAHRPAPEARQADQQVPREVPVDLQELAVVHHAPDHVVHVVRLGRLVGDHVEQLFVPPVRRIAARLSRSEPCTKCATPDVAPCTSAPPRPSKSTSSCVTVFTTLGPVTNMYEMPRTMNTKSVMAGLYTAPPAHGPRIALIWGTTPEASVLRRKMSA